VTHHRTVIVGAGFSGIGMAVRLLRDAERDFVLLERADDLGGTWRDNTYPGCRCDVPSHLYSFSFAPNPNWSSTFSSQQEILDYLRDVARRFGVIEHVRFSCELEGAEWDEERSCWHLRTSQGPMTADVLVCGQGALSEPKLPEIPGIERFEGSMFHSAQWNHDHDLRGERVAVVGTGASAIQLVPKIQPKVAQLHIYQRTPPWVVHTPTGRCARSSARSIGDCRSLSSRCAGRSTGRASPWCCSFETGACARWRPSWRCANSGSRCPIRSCASV